MIKEITVMGGVPRGSIEVIPESKPKPAKPMMIWRGIVETKNYGPTDDKLHLGIMDGYRYTLIQFDKKHNSLFYFLLLRPGDNIEVHGYALRKGGLKGQAFAFLSLSEAEKEERRFLATRRYYEIRGVM